MTVLGGCSTLCVDCDTDTVTVVKESTGPEEV